MHRAILTALALLSVFPGPLSTPCAAQQSSTVRVAVVDDTNAAIPGAQVRLVGQKTLTGVAASNGVATFDGVAPGTYVIIASSRGFKYRAVPGVVVSGGKTTDLSITLQVPPPISSEFPIEQEYLNPQMYSETLKDIDQPLLCQQPVPKNGERYRLLWIPTFDHPVFLRVDVDQAAGATLLTVVWSGEGGYKWGKPAKSERKLTEDEESDLFETLADMGFWTLPSKVGRPENIVVLDGTEWLIEGAKDEKCHVVARYATSLTGLFADQFLAKVAKLKPYHTQDP